MSGAPAGMLRAALVWRDEVMGDVLLEEPRAVTLGQLPTSTFVVPELDLPADFAIIKPGNRGYLLTLADTMGGTIRVDGAERAVSDFLARGGEGDVGGGFRATPIGAGDWGVIDLDDSGDYKLFFQFVAAEPGGRLAPRTPRLLRDATLGFVGTALATAGVAAAGGLAPADIALIGFAAASALTIVTLAIVFVVSALRNANGDQHASLAFSVFLHLAFLLLSYQLMSDENPFVWPGKRELTGEFLVNRLDPTPPEPEPEPVVGPGDKAEEAAPAAAQPVKVNAATKGAEGAAGGEGDLPRARDPNAVDAPPAAPKVALFTDENRKYLDNVIATNLATSLQKFTGLQGPLERGGIGSGTGKGTGFGPGTGTGTTRGSKGTGSGGGGSVDGDFQSSGKIDTGETRKPSGTGGTGSGVKAVKVGFAGGASGDLGGLSKDEIDRVIRARQGVIKACYQKELNRSPGIGGKLVVNFVIAANGTVKSSRVDPGKSTLRNAAVESCVKGQIARLKFPAKGGGVVNYPFIFSQGG
ncbi:MAG: AgmX/PglI C-terminal domain-containing protein [Kofleriaceae bacterium]